ncbi:MAG TPA: ribosome silencing factor [bacterium]|jgi:ribosome-associated protein
MAGTANEADKKNLNSADENKLLWDDFPPEVRSGVLALQEKQVEDIRVYDLREFTPFCDFVVIGTVMSPAQSKVAHSELSKAMETAGMKLHGVEGGENSGWMLIDYWDIVVHIFRPESRKYYNLEGLWADFPWWSENDSD